MDAFGLVLLALAGSAGSVSSATGGGPTSRWTAGPRQDEGLAVELHEGGDYAILVNGQYWLQNAATYFNVDGTLYSTADGTLALTDGPVEGSGSDALGPYRLFTWTWAAGAAAIETSVAVYDDSPSLVFGQKFLSAVAGTSLGDPNGVVSSFPSFQVQDGLPEKGFLSIYGRFLGQKRVTIAKWTAETTQINFGEQAGPLVLFDRSAKALVMSPFDSFMSANAYHDRAGSSVHFGVMGRAEGVPAGHGTRTILHHGEGVNAAVFDWGRALQTYYGREQVSDFTTDYLGYYTDNGAFYYYNTEEGMNYEETVLAVVDHLSEIGLPIKYFQLDSWWYPKGADEGVVEWTALPDVFPNGLQNLYQAVGLPFLAHNRWFSPETTYATENGGEYEFLIEPENGKALPLERRFWDDLLDEARVWGLVTYEQDWLDQTYTGLDALHTDVDLAWRWLNEMHGAADARGINLQYCMALPRFALAALALPRVSQIRVSEDYLATFLNWDIGVSSMFAHALGIPAFKDTYQSSDYTVAARCSRLGGNDAETIEKCLRAFEPGLHSAISSLSAGPVAPGDAIGEMNVTRIMRCCNADGLILKPDRPATLIDAKYIREAFGNAEAGPAGVAWTTHTLYDGATPLEFGVIFWTDMTEEYLISPSASGLGNYLPLFAYRVSSEDEENVNLEARFFPEDGHLPLNANTATYYYDLWYTAPIITLSRGENLFVDIAFLGEMRKWIPVSKQRVSRFEITSNMLQVHLNGVPGEMVKFHLADGTDLTEGAYFLTELPVTFGDSGRAIIECIADPDTPDIPCSTREE